MERYARITEKMRREFVLLQGCGCRWRQCTFCDYHLDYSETPFVVNQAVLSRVTGEFGVLDVINSGSCFELDAETLQQLALVVRERGIHTLWFEAHWMYRHELTEFAGLFPGVIVKFRTGVETFDPALREAWEKGIPAAVTPAHVAQYFQGVCLLFGVFGQTKESISADMEAAFLHFEYFSVNAFVENSTEVKEDAALVSWFSEVWLDRLRAHGTAEVLLFNTDLGVG